MKFRALPLTVALLTLAAAAFADDDSRKGVYVRFAAGPSMFDSLEERRVGVNFPLPYGPAFSEYRRLNAEDSRLGEAALGYSFGNQRVETMFSSTSAEIWDYSGAVDYPTSPYGGWWHIGASYDRLSIRTFSLNAYYDFPSKRGRVSPYFGFGAGAAFVNLPAHEFWSWEGPWYGDDSDASTEEPTPDTDAQTSEEGESPEEGGDPLPTEPPVWNGYYYGERESELSEVSFLTSIFGGVEYRLSSDVRIGLRLGYDRFGDVESDMDGGWGGAVEIRGLSRWSVAATLRLLRL